jgi:CubicO group peptidase (beta-lactamase class C family)
MDLVPLFIEKPMMYNRGERFQYNNTGYAVLGLMIESVTKLPFDVFLKTAVFEPCGILDTGYYELDRLPPNCANSYIWDTERQEYYLNIYSVDVKGTGAGGAFTTAADVERFWDGLFSGKVVSRETLSQMVSPQAEGGEYGYGFWLREDDKTPYFQGSDPGVSFLSSCDEKSGVTITLMSNFGDNVWKLNKGIREHIGL